MEAGENGGEDGFQVGKMMQIKIAHIEKDFPVIELNNKFWQKAQEVLIEKYWSGEDAPIARHAEARLLWSASALYVRFEANQQELLVINKNPNLKSKTNTLWERDVCEIFIAPDLEKPHKYFEFEIAPTSEWLDLAIHQLKEKRETDFNYNSGMESFARIEKDKILMAMKIEWKAFGKKPNVEEVWRGNLFRLVGSGKGRGYLAWSPTKTEKPNFHVPERFGELKFLK